MEHFQRILNKIQNFIIGIRFILTIAMEQVIRVTKLIQLILMEIPYISEEIQS